ncbi:MAG: RNA polymerase sigma factor [Verrucomicrobia bacterium]|nr:RNA polymerase sigma factor [Cytophagales bacterium]
MKNVIAISQPIPFIAEALLQEKNIAIAETFEREKQRLLSFIKKRIPKTDDAEDILQDVFFQLTESFEVLRPIEQMTAWLFKVTRNKIIDRYRKKKPESIEGLALAYDTDGEESPTLLNWIFDPVNNPEEDLTRKLIWETVCQALEEMPVEQKDVFVRHELENKSFKEISEMTEVSVNTLLSRKRYAVLFLRKRLQDIYNEMLH